MKKDEHPRRGAGFTAPDTIKTNRDTRPTCWCRPEEPSDIRPLIFLAQLAILLHNTTETGRTRRFVSHAQKIPL